MDREESYRQRYYGQILMQAAEILLEEYFRTTADVCFRVKGGDLVYAHKTQLAINSRVFEEMFTEDGGLHKDIQVIELPEESYKSVNKFVRTLHEGCEDMMVTPDFACHVIPLLYKFKCVHELEKLERQLVEDGYYNFFGCLENAKKLLSLAEKYHLGVLKEKCLEMIKSFDYFKP